MSREKACNHEGQAQGKKGCFLHGSPFSAGGLLYRVYKDELRDNKNLFPHRGSLWENITRVNDEKTSDVGQDGVP